MENPTTFNLNGAIQQWRTGLAQSPSFRDENLDELESHLRDSVAALESRGLSVEEAFLIAMRRIGRDSLLKAEFGKVNASQVWLDRILWMLIGLQLWTLVSGLISLVTRDAMLYGLAGTGYDFGSHGYAIPATLLTVVHLAGFAGSLVLCWWFLRRKGRQCGRWFGRLLQRRAAWGLVFGALYVLFLFLFFIAPLLRSLWIRSLGQDRIGQLGVSLSISITITQLITSAVLLGLTLLLARKRFGPRPA